MVNPTRIWKLKFKIKDILFVAFQQKKIQNLSEPSMSRYGATVYPYSDQTCGDFVFRDDFGRPKH